MKNIRKQGIDRIICLQISLIFIIGVTLAAGNRIVINTLEQLHAVGDTGTCTYFHDDSETCKYTGYPSFGNGFWSSCEENNCELKIELGRLRGDGAVPTSLEIFSFVVGINSQIRVRVKLTPDGAYHNIHNIEDEGYWSRTVIEIEPSLELTSQSEIYLRLSSGPFGSEFDIFDNITFVYIESPETTPPTQPTTQTASIPVTRTEHTMGPTTETNSSPATEPATGTAPTRPPADFECPEAEGLYADPKNCRGFYNCADFYPYHFCCPLPLFYNPAILRCDFQDMVECHNDPGLPCDSPPGIFNRNSRM